MAQASVVDLWFWPWTAVKTATGFLETMDNARRVIETRVPMIAAAMFNPLDWANPELHRMVDEKVDAFGRSRRSFEQGQRVIQQALRGNARDLGRLAGGDILMPSEWMRIATRNVEALAALTLLPGEILSPIQKRVASNVRRLKP